MLPQDVVASFLCMRKCNSLVVEYFIAYYYTLLVSHTCISRVPPKHDFSQQFLMVFTRCGTSLRKYTSLSGAYILMVLYVMPLETLLPEGSWCIRKNFLFCEAPSTVTAITFKPVLSTAPTTSHTIGYTVPQTGSM